MHDNETITNCRKTHRGIFMRLAAAKGQGIRANAMWSAKLGSVMTICALLGACADLPVFHEPAQFAGFATTAKESEDFVAATRPEKTDFTSVGVETGHPPGKPRDPAGVKQLQAELEAQRDTGHAILQRLSPETANSPAQTSDEKAKAKQAAKKKTQDEAAAKQNSQVPAETPASQ
jgi:hypothetical protein